MPTSSASPASRTVEALEASHGPLPHADRRVLCLHLDYQMKLCEVAHVLGVEPHMVSETLQRWSLGPPARHYRALREVEARHGPVPEPDRAMLSLHLDDGFPGRLVVERLRSSYTTLNECLACYGVLMNLHDYSSVEEIEEVYGTLPEPDHRIFHLYLDCGFSLRQVAEMQGWGYSTVNKRLREWGVRARMRGGSYQKLSNRDFELTRWLYEEVGMTMEEICRAVGRDRNSVRYRLVTAGVKLRPRSGFVVRHRTAEQQQRVDTIIAAVAAQRKTKRAATPA